ncbi:MAG: SDR family oxidoreductase, partial [Candidatus Atribacteria bacterium]|nr:SDR family oxidoreductase [Candidatus Atribacteria bacterium]
MNETVLVTGANGFLGTQVIRCLLKETGFQIIALVRGNNPPDARRRLNRAWWDWPELRKALGKKVEILTGDMVLPQLGLSDDTYQRLVQELTHIIHTAADLRLAGPIEELRAVNVWGTTQLVELARAAHRDHGVVRFTQVSTAYVAGKRTGTISEDSLTDRFGFHNGYEQTKYQGERVVQAIKNELPVTMVRPGMIVGDSRNGQIKNFNTLYYLLRLHLNGKLKILPASPQQRVNLIPVDVVAEAIIRLTLDPRATGGTYHVTLPVESQPTVRELVTFVRS